MIEIIKTDNNGTSTTTARFENTSDAIVALAGLFDVQVSDKVQRDQERQQMNSYIRDSFNKKVLTSKDVQEIFKGAREGLS